MDARERKERESKIETNMIDITDMSDAALEAFLDSKGNPEEAVAVDHLTVKDRHDIAAAYGWDATRGAVFAWIEG